MRIGQNRIQSQITALYFLLVDTKGIFKLPATMIVHKLLRVGKILHAINTIASLRHVTIIKHTGYHTHIHTQIYLHARVQSKCAGATVYHHINPEISLI